MKRKLIAMIAVLSLLALSVLGQQKQSGAVVVTGSLVTKLNTPVTSNSLLTNLISYWKMDEASGDRVDATAAANTLTDNNTVTSTTGIINNSALFTFANSESLSHVDNASLSTGDIDFTFCGWFKFTTNPGASYPGLITKNNAGDIDYYLALHASQSRFNFGTVSGDIDATTFGAISTGTWYFVCAWHDATANTVSIQVNAGTVDSAATSGPATDTAGAFEIGHWSTYGTYLDGTVDEVGFWKRTLTSGERTLLYNSGAGYPYSLFQ